MLLIFFCLGGGGSRCAIFEQTAVVLSSLASVVLNKCEGITLEYLQAGETYYSESCYAIKIWVTRCCSCLPPPVLEITTHEIRKKASTNDTVGLGPRSAECQPSMHNFHLRHTEELWDMISACAAMAEHIAADHTKSSCAALASLINTVCRNNDLYCIWLPRTKQVQIASGWAQRGNVLLAQGSQTPVLLRKRAFRKAKEDIACAHHSKGPQDTEQRSCVRASLLKRQVMFRIFTQ